MKILIALSLGAFAALTGGCIVRHHGHLHGPSVVIPVGHVHSHHCGHYHYRGAWHHSHGHVHGHGCGHLLRAGIWIIAD